MAPASPEVPRARTTSIIVVVTAVVGVGEVKRRASGTVTAIRGDRACGGEAVGWVGSLNGLDGAGPERKEAQRAIAGAHCADRRSCRAVRYRPRIARIARSQDRVRGCRCLGAARRRYEDDGVR